MADPIKILVIRFSSIGDIILTTPVIRCLNQQLGAQVHVLTKKRYAPVLDHNPYIHRLHTIDEDISEVASALRKENFDLIIDLHNNLRSQQVRQALRIPTHAFRKLNVEKWLLVNTGLNLLPNRHIVERYMATVRDLGVTYDERGLDMCIGKDVLVPENLPETPFIALAIGAGLPTKNLEINQQHELIQNIKVPVALLGGPEDLERGETLAAGKAHVMNYAGKATLQQSAAILERAELLITPDTGLMHMAAALGKPILSVWGNTVPVFGMTPCYPADQPVKHEYFEVHELSCRPCSKIGFQSCPKEHFKCIRNLDLAAIADKANQWAMQPVR